MAEFFPPVIFEVQAKATEAIASFQKVNTELAKMEKNGVLAGGALGKMERAGKLAGTAFLGLAGAVGVLGVASLKTLDEFDKAQVNLEQAVKNTGVSFEAAQPVIKAHADEMKALGFTYTDTYAALAKMTAASGSPQVALNTLSAAADLARFKNISLADAGTLLARATIGQAKGLGDLGIAIGKTLPKGASLAQILKAVEDRAGGTAKAFKTTLGGSLQVAQANFQALEISIGTNLLPSAIKLTNWISNTAIPGFRSLIDFIKNNLTVFKGLAAVLAIIWAVPKVQAIISVIQTLIKTYNALRLAAGTAAIAEAFATGGLSIAVATGAIATAAAVYGGFKLKDLLSKGDLGAGGASTPYNPQSGNLPDIPNLQGKGVQRYSSGKSAKSSKTAQTVHYNTFNIQNPNPHATAQAIVKVTKLGAPITK
jgi:hypothetical protein